MSHRLIFALNYKINNNYVELKGLFKKVSIAFKRINNLSILFFKILYSVKDKISIFMAVKKFIRRNTKMRMVIKQFKLNSMFSVMTTCSELF